MPFIAPGELEVTAWFRQHLGPRFSAAGVTLQFHYNQEPGIHLKTKVPSEYQEWILNGVRDGMAKCFPEFPSSGSVWIVAIVDDDIDSSQMAFYRAARLAVSQASALVDLSREAKRQAS
jgi:hypothetical protein